MLAGQRNFTQVIPHLLRVIRIIQGQRGHADDGVHGSADVMAHTGQKVLLCHIGLFRFLSRCVHLCVHTLQLGYLNAEQLQISEEYVEEHGNHREGGGVDDGKPAVSHA